MHQFRFEQIHETYIEVLNLKQRSRKKEISEILFQFIKYNECPRAFKRIFKLNKEHKRDYPIWTKFWMLSASKEHTMLVNLKRPDLMSYPFFAFYVGPNFICDITLLSQNKNYFSFKIEVIIWKLFECFFKRVLKISSVKKW